MADAKLIWAVSTSLGQTPDRAWHTPEDGPFQIEERLFSRRWMRKAKPEELAAAGVPEAEGADDPVALEDLDDDKLRERYELVLGEKPHHAAKRETLIQKITDKLNAD